MGIEPMDATASRQASEGDERPQEARDGPRPYRRQQDQEVQPDQDGRQEQPEPAEQPDEERVLEHGRDHRGEQRLGEGVERPAAYASGEDEARSQLEAGRRKDEQRNGQRDGQLAEDPGQGRVDIESEEVGRLEHDQPEQERQQPEDPDQVQGDLVTIAKLPSLHRRDGTRRAAARSAQRRVERAAGLEPATSNLEGSRYYQLSYARRGCPARRRSNVRSR